MKTKKDLIEAMVGVGVKKVTLPVKEGVRTSPLEIDLSEKINVTASYKPTGEANDMIKNMEGLSGTLADLVVKNESGAWIPNPAHVDNPDTLVNSHTRDMSDLIGVPKAICDLTGLSIEVVGSADIVSEGGTEYSDSHRDRDLAPASMAGDDDLDGLARRPRRTPARHCPGCAILIPAESTREYCEMCD